MQHNLLTKVLHLLLVILYNITAQRKQTCTKHSKDRLSYSYCCSSNASSDMLYNVTVPQQATTEHMLSIIYVRHYLESVYNR